MSKMRKFDVNQALTDHDFKQLCLQFDRMKDKENSSYDRELRYIGQHVLPLLRQRIEQHVEQEQLSFDFDD